MRNIRSIMDIYLNINGIACFNWLKQAVRELFFLSLALKSAEHSVPYDQKPRVVLVRTVRIGGVVDSVMARSVQNELQNPQARYELCVQPELVQRVHVVVSYKH